MDRREGWERGLNFEKPLVTSEQQGVLAYEIPHNPEVHENFLGERE